MVRFSVFLNDNQQFGLNGNLFPPDIQGCVANHFHGTILDAFGNPLPDPRIDECGWCSVTFVQCELAVTFTNTDFAEPNEVRRGKRLHFNVYLHHKRPRTVSVSIFMYIEDAEGNPVAGKQYPPHIFHFDDKIHRNLSYRIPKNFKPGPYNIVIGVGRMAQGVVVLKEPFYVVE